MNRIAGYIREGAMAFLVREYKVLALYCVVVAVVIGLALGQAGERQLRDWRLPVAARRLSV